MNRNILTATPITLDASTGKPVSDVKPVIRRGRLSALWNFICALAVMALVVFQTTMQKAQAALVEYDGTNVSWSVTDLLDPLTTALVAAVAAAVVIFTIVVGVRWIFRMVKGSK